MVTAREFETAISRAGSDSEPQGEFEIRQRGWIKQILPRTMFGRSLLIFVVPLVVLQSTDSDTNAARLLEKAAAVTDLDLKVSAGERLAGLLPSGGTLLEDQL